MLKTFTFNNIYNYKIELIRKITNSENKNEIKKSIKRNQSCPLF